MDKDQYQEPEVAYEADEGITAIASSVRLFSWDCAPFQDSGRIRTSFGYPEAKTPKSAVTLMENPIFMG